MNDEKIIEGLDSFLKKAATFLTGATEPEHKTSVFNVGGRVAGLTDPVADMYSAEALKTSLVSTYVKIDDILNAVKQMGGNMDEAKSDVQHIIKFIQDGYKDLADIIENPKNFSSDERTDTLNKISKPLEKWIARGGEIDLWKQKWLGKDNSALAGTEYYNKGKELKDKATKILAEIRRTQDLRTNIRKTEVQSVFRRAMDYLSGKKEPMPEKPKNKGAGTSGGKGSGKTPAGPGGKKYVNIPIKNPNGSGSNFFELPGLEEDLSKDASKVGIELKRNKGIGKSFDQADYEEVKKKTTVYWAVYDISGDKLLGSSKNAEKNIKASALSTVVLSGAAIARKGGYLPSEEDYTKMIQLLVISDNKVWDDIQKIAGGADAVNKFSKDMGYTMLPAREGGNRVNAVDMCKYWRDVITGKFKGSEIVYKITSACKTDAAKGRKYIPSDCYMGGKTATLNEYNHSSSWINVNGKFYAITVLTDGKNTPNELALMFGGLYKEFVKK